MIAPVVGSQPTNVNIKEEKQVTLDSLIQRLQMIRELSGGDMEVEIVEPQSLESSQIKAVSLMNDDKGGNKVVLWKAN